LAGWGADAGVLVAVGVAGGRVLCPVVLLPLSLLPPPQPANTSSAAAAMALARVFNTVVTATWLVAERIADDPRAARAHARLKVRRTPGKTTTVPAWRRSSVTDAVEDGARCATARSPDTKLKHNAGRVDAVEVDRRPGGL